MKPSKIPYNEVQSFLEKKFNELNIKPSDANFIFFWGPRPRHFGTVDESCACQWLTAPFTHNGVRFRTAEHAMMYAKAELFNCPDIMQEILNTITAREAKRLGRKVRGFNEQIWQQHDYETVKQINISKFTTHPQLFNWITSLPENTVLVEASPFDCIWGIHQEDLGNLDLTNTKNWEGLNKLGFALTEVMRELQQTKGKSNAK